MMRLSVVLALALGFVQIRTEAAEGTDPCRAPVEMAAKFKLILEKTGRDASGSFTGVFRVENHTTQPLKIGGVRKKGEFWIGRPDTELEYLDLSPTWLRVVPFPGSFSESPDELVVKPGEAGRFSTQLMSRDLANRSARPFRLLTRAKAPHECLVSKPFEGLPRRPDVQDLVTTTSDDN